jgi:hypothetical protein
MRLIVPVPEYRKAAGYGDDEQKSRLQKALKKKY